MFAFSDSLAAITAGESTKGINEAPTSPDTSTGGLAVSIEAPSQNDPAASCDEQFSECTEFCDCRLRQSESDAAHLPFADFGNIVDDVAKTSFEQRGLAHLLLMQPERLCVIGIDQIEVPCRIVSATNSQIWAVGDLVDRAVAIITNDIFALCPETRRLVESVAEAGVVGWAAQGRLCPKIPYRKSWPWWYQPPRRWPRDTRPGLFEAFGIDVNAAPADQKLANTGDNR